MHLLDLPVLLLHSLQGQVPHVSLQDGVCVARPLLFTEIKRIQGQWGNGRWRGLVSRSPGKTSFQKHQVANHGTFQLGPGGRPGVQRVRPQAGAVQESTGSLGSHLNSSSSLRPRQVPCLGFLIFEMWRIILASSLSQRSNNIINRHPGTEKD